MIREASLLPPFIGLRAHARWASGLLLANMALAWIAVGIGLSELQLLFRASAGGAVTPLERTAQFVTNQWLVVGQITLLLAGAVAFLAWLYQARVNVRALGVRRPAHARQWAVLAFLVPVVNLFRPYQVVSEVWRASDPANLDPFTWRLEPLPGLVPGWWGLCMAATGAAVLATLSGLGAGVNLAKLELTAMLAVGANLLAGLAAGAASLLITRISDAQEAKYARLLASEEEKPE